jgi:Tfp pilus assembly protein PilF
LLDAFPEERQVWMQDYMEDKSQILNLYNAVTKEISKEINVLLTPKEKDKFSEARNINTQAYDAYLKGYSYIEDMSKESLFRARDFLNGAIEKDPDWAPLYAALATVWLSIGSFGAEPPEVASPAVYNYLQKALDLDPDLAEAHYVSAFMAWTAEWDWEKAEKEFLKALSINPNHAVSRMHYSHVLFILQRPEEGIAQANLAYRLDPLNPAIQSTYAASLLGARDYISAFSILDKLLASDPDNFLANNVMEPAAFQCGILDRAFEAFKHFSPLEEGAMKMIEKIYNDKGFKAAYAAALQELEILSKDTYLVPTDMAIRYYFINEDDKVLDWIEKGTEVRDPSTLYVGTGFCNFTRLHDKPRFMELLRKMNLPLP